MTSQCHRNADEGTLRYEETLRQRKLHARALEMFTRGGRTKRRREVHFPRRRPKTIRRATVDAPAAQAAVDAPLVRHI